jgi:hypothetical protein
LSSKRFGILDPAKKSLHGGKSYLDNLAGYMAVRYAMDALSGFFVWCIYQAKRSAALMVEPVGQKLHSILVLDFEILPMCLGNVCGAISFEIMTIHVYGHRLPLPRSPRSVCPIGILGNRSIPFRF